MVAGLSEGQFPSCRRTAAGPVASDGGWLTRADEFPYPLRGDASSLPGLATDAPTCAGLAADIEDFRRRNLEHLLLEERRLAYVAVTRARSQLLLSSSRFLPGVAHAVPPSRFLGEVVARVPPGFAVVPEPGDGDTNPDLKATRSARYPLADPAGERRVRLDRSAGLVTAARRELDEALGPVSAADGPREHIAALETVAGSAPGRVAELAEQAGLLLAERVAPDAVAVELGSTPVQLLPPSR